MVCMPITVLVNDLVQKIKSREYSLDFILMDDMMIGLEYKSVLNHWENS